MTKINDTVKSVDRAEKVLQFGEGNFLRAFVDWQIDIANEKTDFNSNVVIAQPLASGLSKMINDQNGKYTTILRGVKNDKIVKEFRKITSVSRCINIYENFNDYIKLAESEDLRFIISNTTEAGISYAPNCTLNDTPPISFPAKITQLLYKRYLSFNKKGHGIIFIPCELIEKNGDNLKKIIVQYAKEWALEKDFLSWIDNECIFCNSLVDRIVTGYPREEANEICNELGYEDNLLDTAELFHLWVIETQGNIEELKKEFPLAQAGLNVIWTDDMSFYRTRKVRILNGVHTLSVLASHLYGVETVDEALNNPTLFKFINKGLFEEIIPSMDGDKDMLTDYAKDVLDRFKNPYLRHKVLSISLNSTSKFKTRDLPSVLGYYDKYNKIPSTLAFSLASLIKFYEGSGIENRSMKANYNDKSYLINDDESVLHFFEDLYKNNDKNSAEGRAKIVNSVLSNSTWWGSDLTKLTGFENEVYKHFSSIVSNGINKALTDYCN